ncbi:hypothetical protein [Streptomyces showdoensis]|uniref:hypothetical protein n=1 Tax=Streptomyces showdoensis TaxID=68268 RepID=UPI000F50CD4A|nr:hypothetical protein [Streptomyces showdoensis]
MPATGTTLSTARLFSAPLPELLAEADAKIVESSIDDSDYYGAIVKPPVGPAIVCIPESRSAAERSVMARLLVGRLLGAPMLPLPSSVEARTFGGAR